MRRENSGIQVQWMGRGGGVVYLDNLDFEQDPSTTDPANTTIFSDPYVNALKTAFATGTPGNPGTLRYNAAPDAETLDSWILPANARMMSHAGIRDYNGGAPNTALQDFLHLCHVLGVDPMIIMPITFTEADSRGLVDFLYGGSATTYGAKRIATGGPPGGYQSWFHTIHLELGNENWNAGFLGQAVGWRFKTSSGYQDYTARFNTIGTAMRAMPSYLATRTELIMGAIEAGAGVNLSEVANYGHPDAIEIAE
jgi:hypothetical protein